MAGNVMDTRSNTDYSTGRDRADNYEQDEPRVTVAAAMDRVRWAAVLGGVATVLSVLVTLTVLGIALGLSAYDPNNNTGLGAGAGIYGAVAALVAFFFGAFVAARSSAVAGAGNGLINGIMVWMVTLVLIVNLLGAGIGTLLGVTTDVVTTTAQAAADVAGPVAAQALDTNLDPALQPTAQAAATQAAAGVAGAVQDVQEQIENISPADVDRTAQDLGNAAWGALLILGLTAGVALLGGVLGARTYPTDIAVSRR